MTTVTTNYTVVGNPVISSDYVLTGTDANNYLTFNEEDVFDASKSYDIIFKFKTSNINQPCGILEIGNGSASNKSISIYYQYGRVYARLGRASLYIYNSDFDPSEEMYYKISYDSTNLYAYSYYSIDGENWVLSYSRSVSEAMAPSPSTSNNIIGLYSSYGLTENVASLYLTELVITSDGDEWYKAVKTSYEPIVEATEVYSMNKTFKGKKQITQINCNNVQFVNNDMSFAFVNCVNLTNVSNINQNTTNMAYAFAGCPTELYDTGFPTIPNSVNDITGLFAYHTDWTDIPVQAFVNAWSKVPAHLQTNVAGFLDGCTNLSNVPANTLPNFMINIAYAFRNCKAMTDMPIITENIVNMSEAFYGCSNLTNANYEIPNSVVNMHLAFSNCQNLTSTPIMINATNLVDMSYAFNYCYGITNSKPLPNNVQNIVGLFNSCTNLTTGPNIPYGIQDITRLFALCTNLVNAPAIPNSVTTMYLTFASCYNLTSIPVIPNSVVNLVNTFSGCRNLTQIPTLPNSVVNMKATFSSCSNLVNAPVIPNSVVDMSYIFSYCYNLVNAPVIPNSVVDMSYSFISCPNLPNAPVIPNSVENLFYTFSGCNSLVNAPVISNNVKNMKYTFSGCINLIRAPIIPNGVEAMEGTFRSCSNLVNAPSIPDSVKELNRTFWDCSNLVNAPEHIPDGINDVDYLFMNCYKLTNVPAIPNGVLYMRETFCGCNSLVNAPSIPNTVVNMFYTFQNCTNLVDAPEIPNSVSYIGYAFHNCIKLKNTQSIGNSITNMYYTFYNCQSLIGNIYIKSENIINALYCFYNTSLQKNVYIPFTYSNSVNTLTYNAFISAGYDEFGTNNGVYLRDINPLPEVEEGERYRMDIITDSGEGA